MNHINDKNQISSTYNIIDKISSYLPEINTISGMLFYTFILYALGVLVKCCFGDWGLGIGDWGLGIGDWGLGPIPNPQSPNKIQ